MGYRGHSPLRGQMSQPYVVVLGTVQDAGFPQAHCKKKCCTLAWQDKSMRGKVSCIGIVDPRSGVSWMIDATPDFKDQHHLLLNRDERSYDLGGIFLTHAHMGHYTGLIHLGKEAIGAKGMPVYAMPRMAEYLKNNGPWSQLVDLDNIDLRGLVSDSTQTITSGIEVTPLLVPHRDEFSETVGFSIQGPVNSLLFIPDIDKWSKWDRDLIAVIDAHDYALIDGSFYDDTELPGRDMSEIPHPFIVETMLLLEDLPDSERAKVHFIHLNHTNPILDKNSQEYGDLHKAGFHTCEKNKIFLL